MPILRFHYYEVMDRDHTLTRVELIDAGVATHVYTNFPTYWENAVQKAVYGNQVEDFVFPSSESALQMIASNPDYRPLTSALERFFSVSLD